MFVYILPLLALWLENYDVMSTVMVNEWRRKDFVAKKKKELEKSLIVEIEELFDFYPRKKNQKEILKTEREDTF